MVTFGGVVVVTAGGGLFDPQLTLLGQSHAPIPGLKYRPELQVM